MHLRKAVRWLVFTLPVLLVAFAILMAGMAICDATEDQAGAAILYRVAMGALCLLAINLILLVGGLGALAISGDDSNDDSP